jgi:predicted transcriptional regulator
MAAKKLKADDTLDLGVGPLEAQVLGAMAELTPPVSVRQVCDALGKSGYFAYQAVLNCMNRMAAKGTLERTKERNAYLFRPLVTADEVAARIITSVVSQMGRDLDRVVCQALNIDPELGAKEIAKLRERVGAMGRKRKR